MQTGNSTATLTFGDCAENHVGMEKVGERGAVGTGFHLSDLCAIVRKCIALGLPYKLWPLHSRPEHEPAYLLVIKGLSRTESLMEEQLALEESYDRMALMRKRVVNKRARWNLCFTKGAGHGPSYSEGKGTVVSFEDVPHLKQFYEALPAFFGPKATNLEAEANYYYDLAKCGIGYHGDTERRKVIAVRLGATMPICFQWFHRSEPIGPRMRFDLSHGDVYVMSEKAVGGDWKSSSKWTLRHAAGAASYIDLKPETGTV